jgi:WD40 repeat protein
MGNCFPFSKSERSKYEENEDIPTHRIDSIQLKSQEYISGLAVYSEDSWVLSQENNVSLYNDFICTNYWQTSERIRATSIDMTSVITGGKTIEIYTHKGKLQGKLAGHEHPVSSLCSRNNLLLSGSNDWSIRLWDLFTLQEIDKSTINWNVITCIKWATESLAIQTSEDLRLRLWDIRERKLIKSSGINVGENFATCCDVSGNYILTGHRGFSGNGCDVKLWDLRKREQVLTLKEHQQSVEAVKITEENLVSCGKDGKIFMYKLDGTVIEQWKHPLEKPFVTMELYKQGMLVANIEPKIMFFSFNPLLNEF